MTWHFLNHDLSQIYASTFVKEGGLDLVDADNIANTLLKQFACPYQDQPH